MNSGLLKIGILSLFLITLVSCKTAEEIRREQMVDTLSVQMVQNQKLAADLTVKLQDLEKKTGQLQGTFEETGHAQQMKQKEQITAINDQINVINESLKALKDQAEEQEKILKMMQAQLDNQKDFIEQVTQSLGKITTVPKKAKKMSAYEQAMDDYSKGRYKEAETQFLGFLKNNSVKGKAKYRVLHNLGIIAYIKKDYDNALLYFSKVFTQDPKGSYTPNSLLHVARSFKKLNKNDEAKEAIHELLSRFPQSKRAEEAKKLLKEL